MKPMKLEGLEIVEVDTVWSKLPKSFYDLKPTVYKNGNVFCCLLGDDQQEGIFGCGGNPQEAIQDWHNHLSEVVSDAKQNTELSRRLRTYKDNLGSNANGNYKGEF